MAAEVVVILDDFLSGSTRPSLPGEVRLTHETGGEKFPLWFLVTQVEDVRNHGLSGAALLEALSSEPWAESSVVAEWDG